MNAQRTDVRSSRGVRRPRWLLRCGLTAARAALSGLLPTLTSKDCPQACLAGRRPPLLSIGHADGPRTEEHHHGTGPADRRADRPAVRPYPAGSRRSLSTKPTKMPSSTSSSGCSGSAARSRRRSCASGCTSTARPVTAAAARGRAPDRAHHVRAGSRASLSTTSPRGCMPRLTDPGF